MALQIRRGTDAERQGITPVEGELIYTTDTNQLYVGGKVAPSTSLEQGGILISGQLINDSNPTLNSNLDLNGNNITGAGNIQIDGFITATGNINLGDGVEDNVIVGGQIGSSLIPGSDASYDLGTTTSNWRNVYTESLTVDGQIRSDSIMTGNIVLNDSTVVYDAATSSLTVNNVYADSINGNFVGSVFADDSTTIVDAISKSIWTQKIYGTNISEDGLENPVEIGTKDNTSGLRVFGGQGDGIQIDGVFDGLEGPTLRTVTSRGTYDAPQTMNVGDITGAFATSAWNGTDYQTTGSFATFVTAVDGVTGELSGGCGMVIPVPGTGETQFTEFGFYPNGNATIPGQITAQSISADVNGSVFADDSSLLVDAVNGTIPGYISIAELKSALQDGAGDYAAFKSYILAL